MHGHLYPLGLLGILVSIAVGFGTYYLTEKKARTNRWQGAKETVLRDLSKSLGEGNVPESRIITATIRSVLRSYNSPNLEAVTLDEVADDLLRQITSDPFLDSERRSLLQAKVIELKATRLEDAESGNREKFALEMRTRSLNQSVFGALLAGLLASLAAAGIFSAIPHLVKVVREHIIDHPQNFLVASLSVLLTLLSAMISIYAAKYRK